MAQTEPRWGERAVLAATVICPEGPLLCYCLHMEVSMPRKLPGVCAQLMAICRLNTIPCLQVFCGMLARLEQFADVLQDSREQIAKVQCCTQCHQSSLSYAS